MLDVPGVLAEIAGHLAKWRVSIESMIQRGRAPGEAVSIVMITHETTPGGGRKRLEDDRRVRQCRLASVHDSHGSEIAPGSGDFMSSLPLDRAFALEAVRVTEAAAIAAAEFIGRGDETAADHAAVEAMRRRSTSADRRHGGDRRGRTRRSADALYRREGRNAAASPSTSRSIRSKARR